MQVGNVEMIGLGFSRQKQNRKGGNESQTSVLSALKGAEILHQHDVCPPTAGLPAPALEEAAPVENTPPRLETLPSVLPFPALSTNSRPFCDPGTALCQSE